MQGTGSGDVTTKVHTTAEGLPLPFSTSKYVPPTTLKDETQLLPSGQSVFLPPPPPPQSTPSVVTLTKIENPSAVNELPTETVDLSSAHEFCRKIFSCLLNDMALKEGQVKVAEIQKRLEILNSMWDEEKFDQKLQLNLYEIARSIRLSSI